VLAVHSSRWKACNDQEVANYKAEHPDDYLPGASADLDTPRKGWYAFNRVENAGRDCVVDQTNWAAQCSTGKLLVGVQDDYFPPEHWDTLLLDAFEDAFEEGGYPESDWNEGAYVLVCSTGATPERDRELMIGGACTRAVVERRGYALDPDFESMFSDNWWAFENRRDAAAGLLTIIERLDIKFDHRHPTLGKGQLDEVYALQNRAVAYYEGYNTFARKAGLKLQRSIAVCLPGEEFRSEWVCRWTQLFGHLTQVHQFMTLPFFGHSSNVYCTRIEMAKGVLESPIPCEFSLWIDDDNTLTPDHFDMLLSDLDAHPEKRSTGP
jgi:hypothetical protein